MNSIIMKCITLYRYYKSFHGGDFKILAQMALFLLWDYINDEQKKVWLALSKVVHNNLLLAWLVFNISLNS